MEDLRYYLTQYKDCTLKLINCIEKDDIDNLQKYFDERQDLIDSMENIKYTKEEFKSLCSELDILILQKKLTDLMMEKKGNLKDEIDKFQEVKSADKNYKKKYHVDSIFFNKKI